MPNIPPLPPVVPASPGAGATGHDWEGLLLDVSKVLSKYLDPADLNSLSLTSAHLHGAPTAQAFDQACRAAILKAESGELRGLPLVDATRFAGKASGLGNAGFPHAARLLTLCEVTQGLASVPTGAATHVSCPMPGLDVNASPHGAVCARDGTPEYVGHVRDPVSGRLRIAFCSTQGDIRMPESLQDATLVSSDPGGLMVYDSRISRDDTTLLVRADPGARLALYRPDVNHIEFLPEMFGGASIAAISTNAQYVVAGVSGRLLVYDRETREVVTNVVGTARWGLSVDSLGQGFVGTNPFTDGNREGFVLGRGGKELSCSHFVQGAHWGRMTLCPNDRYLVKMFVPDLTTTLVLVDTHRREFGIQLLPHGTSPSRLHSAVAIAFSPANAMVAVAYTDDTVSLFDLAGLGAGGAMPSHVVAEEKRKFALPVDTGYRKPALFFSRDGSRLDVVYHTGGPRPAAEFLRYSLLDRDGPPA